MIAAVVLLLSCGEEPRRIGERASALQTATAPVPAGDGKVFPGVSERIASAGRAQVIINLHDPVAIDAPRSSRLAAVARVQEAVLARVNTATYQPLRRWELVPGLAGVITAGGLREVVAAPEVASVQLDGTVHANLKESVPAIHADSVRTQLGFTGKGITVAVLDTGVDLNHPDVGPAVTGQQCFTQGTCPPNNTFTGASAQDANGHGTHVSGIITSDGVKAPIGFAPDASIVGVRVLDGNGNGNDSDIVSGLNWVLLNNAQLKVNVVNMSLGSNMLFAGNNCDAAAVAMANVTAQLQAANVTVFAASGNGGSSSSISSPGCCSAVIAVGATYDGNNGRQPPNPFVWSGSNCFDAVTSLDTITCFTNISSKVSMVAPGSVITSAKLGGTSVDESGTSQATPTAAGVAALMLQIDPTFKPADIESWMKSSGVVLFEPRSKLSFPRIDALAAVQTAIAKQCVGRKDGTPCSDNDKCTTDSCVAGACVSAPVKCVAKDQCHDAGKCDPLTGTCSDPTKPDNFACSDGSACTQKDTCQLGVCVGTNPVVCVAKDACHVAGACDPMTGKCSDPNAPNNLACNDGNACTQKDACQNGVCVGGMPVVCVALDQCHEAGVCDAQSGKCSDPAKPAMSPCNDGDACTQKDACVAGVCVGASPVVCAALDQCHDVGVCNPLNGTCSNPARMDGAPCDDGSACTRSDACRLGICVGAMPVICMAKDSCHRAGVCDPQSGLCSDPLAPDGAGCDDDNACTRVDKCQAGVCVGASNVVCKALDACHVAGQCDPKTGACSNPNGPDAVACDDGNDCTKDDACSAGKCGGVPYQCTPNACQSASLCDGKGGCFIAPANEGKACDDGNLCTRSDACRAGQCGGEAVVCPAPQACEVAVACDKGTGNCVSTPRPDGTACPGGSCSAGACKASGCGCEVGGRGGPGPRDGSPLALVLLVGALVGRRRGRAHR